MKIQFTKEWCQRMAKLEGDAEISAGLPDAIWGPGHSLQIDSHYTGRRGVSLFITANGTVQLDITDGRDQWSTEIPLPRGFLK